MKTLKLCNAISKSISEVEDVFEKVDRIRRSTRSYNGELRCDDVERKLDKVNATLQSALAEAYRSEDAALISASPDLLAALKFALPLLKAYEGGEWAVAVSVAQKAIDKATGGVK